MKTTTADKELALRFVRGDITEGELRAGLIPTPDDIILALQAEAGRLRREREELAEDLKEALKEIERLGGRTT